MSDELLASQAYAVVSVTSSATPLVSAVNNKRNTLLLKNQGATECFIAPDGNVTTANGRSLAASGGSAAFDVSDGLARFRWYAITASGTTSVSVIEGFEE